MTRTSAADSMALPSLPHWETIPDDLPAAIRTIKHALQGGSQPPDGPSRRYLRSLRHECAQR